MPNEITTNEIIERMRPYGTQKIFKFDDCYISVSDILDIFDRQQAKFEALQMNNEQLQNDIINANMNCEHADAEIIRLQAERDFYYKALMSQQNTQSATALNYGAYQEARRTAIMNKINSDNIRLMKLLEEAEAKETKAAKRFYKMGIKDFAHTFTERFILLLNLNSEQAHIARECSESLAKKLVGDAE